MKNKKCICGKNATHENILVCGIKLNLCGDCYNKYYPQENYF